MGRPGGAGQAAVYLPEQLNDADLPQTAAELVTDAMANALNRKLEELNVAPQRLAWSDGEIEIYA